jgi:hypothetical protein
MSTTVEDRWRGRKLTSTLRPEFIRSITDLPHDRLEQDRRRIAPLLDDAIFIVTETRTPAEESVMFDRRGFGRKGR